MTPNRHRFNPFEWLIVAAVIGVIVVVGMHYYNSLAERAVAMNMQMSGRNFATAAQMVRAYWHLLPEGERRVVLDGGDPRRWLESGLQASPEKPAENTHVWVNNAGWPVDAGPAREGELSADACKRVWHALLKVEKSAKVGDIYWERLVVTQPGDSRCRYSLQREGGEAYTFEYDSANGQTVFRGE